MRAIRRTRPLPRPDMTPLVNIALLLIVFFVWVRQLQQPVALQVAGPVCCKCEDNPVVINNALYLLDSNRIGLLTYLPDKKSMELVEIDYSANKLRKQLALTAQNEHSTVLITPTPNSTVKNLVDVLDELRINGRVQFTISYGLTPEERRILAAYQRYKQKNLRYPMSMPVSFYPKRITGT